LNFNKNGVRQTGHETAGSVAYVGGRREPFVRGIRFGPAPSTGTRAVRAVVAFVRRLDRAGYLSDITETTTALERTGQRRNYSPPPRPLFVHGRRGVHVEQYRTIGVVPKCPREDTVFFASSISRLRYVFMYVLFFFFYRSPVLD